ncbi:hypothetical protein H0I29_02805 [Polaribacter sp. R2A056_3_33]|jgi:CRISPR/Cas system endoribonuclease Cas6 (RAMP superfamily)|uniref:hypothetical protein n=1 Tax=Polaribacter sp. R2A056_3_33 TaxID=2745563 RepID=UPI001C4E64C9|nr:hypothetical protein [Polaribacter sp. R2A056_3_33]QXP71042.1 hypothetical protein H0I29_02805 [Polaribacter sp. R2A056_3_33]
MNETEFRIWKSKVIDISIENNLAKKEIRRIQSCKKSESIKRYIFFCLGEHHSIFIQNKIEFTDNAYFNLSNYRSKLINYLISMKVEEKHIKAIGQFQWYSKIKKYLNKELPNFKNELTENGITYKPFYLTNETTKEPIEFFDKTENSIRTILTPMGNKK